MGNKILSILLSLIPIVGLFFTACSNEEADQNGELTIQGISPNKVISDFFDREWPFLTSNNTESFYTDIWQDTCNIVNTKQELDEIYLGSHIIPEIDFQHYSLIIGKKACRTAIGEKRPAEYIRQDLYKGAKGYVLDLYCKYSIPDVSFYDDQFVCFWGIYPKINKENIAIKILYVD